MLNIKKTEIIEEDMKEIAWASWGSRLQVQEMNKIITFADIREKTSNLSTRQLIEKAQRYYESNEIVQAGIGLIVDAGSSGFQNQSTKSSIREYYNNLCRKFNFDHIVRDMWRDLMVTSNIVLYWRTIDNIDNQGLWKGFDIESIMCLNPSQVTPLSSFQPDRWMAKLELDEDFICLAKREGIYRDIDIADIKLLLDGYPEHWITAARTGKKTVILKPENGDHLLIEKDGRVGSSGFAKPKMRAIFQSLEEREILEDSDWNAGTLMKALIMQISLGEQGPPNNPKLTYATKTDRDAIREQMERPDKSMVLYTPHHVKIEFLFPDPKIFSVDKYKACESRILRWMGLNPIMVGGEGGTYASAYLNVQGLLARIEAGRLKIGRLIERFYEQVRPRDVRKMGILDRVPSISWDKQVLEDPLKVLRRVQLLMDEGKLSAATAMEKLGFEPREEEARKLEEWMKLTGGDEELAKKLVGIPTWEKAQGILEEIMGKILGFEGTKGTKGAKGTKKMKGRPMDQERPRPSEQEPRPATSMVVVEEENGKIEEGNGEALADYKTDDYYHIDSAKGGWKSDKIIGSKKLDNGVVLRLAMKTNGKSGVKIVLIPVGMVKNLTEAEKKAKEYF